MRWPKIDTVRAVAIYVIAGYIVWKTLSMLEGFVSNGTVGGDAALGIIGGLVLAVAGFLFAAEQSKGNQAAFEKGLNTPSPGGGGTTTVEGGDPTIVVGGGADPREVEEAARVAPGN